MSDDDKQVVRNDFHLLPTSGHAGTRRMMNTTSGQKCLRTWRNLLRNVTNVRSKSIRYGLNNPWLLLRLRNRLLTKYFFLDVVGPLDKDYSDYSYILTLQCELSKYVEAYPLVRKDSVSVARAFVNNFILR